MITNTLANQVLNLICGNGSSVSGGTAYLALSTTTTNVDGTNFSEPSDSAGYSRVLIGNYAQPLTQCMEQASNGSTTNKKEIHFNAVEEGASWGTLTYAGIYTAATGGTLLLAGEIGYYDDQDVWHASPITPSDFQVVTLKVGSINFSFRESN